MNRLKLGMHQTALDECGNELSSYKNLSKLSNDCHIASGGGGTKVAPSKVTFSDPIQFCEVRNSPGCFSDPRPVSRSSPWISLIKRRESGSLASRLRP